MRVSNMSTIYRQMSNFQALNGMMTPQTPVPAVPRAGSSTSANPFQGALSQDSVDYVREYQKDMSSLRDTANSLRNAGSPTETEAQRGATADGIETMVSQYNDSLKLLNDNADRGTGGLRQMKRLLTATGNERSMEHLGITAAKDGTLKFDRSTYLENAKADPTKVKNALGGSFGLASRLYNAANSGLTHSSRTLLSQDLKAAGFQSALRPQGTYNRMGGYTPDTSQTMGALLNRLI